jgi:hypothetical protein
MIECFPVFRAVEQKPWVRRDVERRFFQAVIFQVHAIPLAKTVPQEASRGKFNKHDA